MKFQKCILMIMSLGIISVNNVSISQNKNSISDTQIGLRKTDLFSEQKTTGSKTAYIKNLPGTSNKIERAFENAPPMIPHSIAEFPAITKDLNICLTCHAPEIAPSVKSTPIPQSHFASFRPIKKINEKGELMVENKVDVNNTELLTVMHKKTELNKERFVCTSCHAPQSTNAPLVKNNFSAEFRNAKDKNNSNLLDVLNEGVE